MCSRHPDRPASASCARCGGFICVEDEVRLGGRVYCRSCAVHPDVDYLEAFRLQRWGKRTLGAWAISVPAIFFCVFALVMVLVGVVERDRSTVTAGAVVFAAAAGGLAFFLRVRWSRIAVFAFPLIPCAMAAAARDFFWVKFLLGATALVAYLVLDPGTRLFFKLECSRQQLQRAWHRHANNWPALAGFRSGVVAAALRVYVRLACGDP